MPSPLPEWKKRLILVVGLLEILIFSGTILGWTSLKLMLKNEGIYEYKCRVHGHRPAPPVLGNASAIAAASASAINSNSSLSSSPPLSLAATAVNETGLLLTNNGSNSFLPPTATLANISLQLNLTITAPALAAENDSRQKSQRLQSSSVELAPLTEKFGGGNGSDGVRTIVIPFQATTTSLNQSFIYHLLRDESVVLTTSSRNDSNGGRGGKGIIGSSASLSLFSDRLRRHKDRHHNVSTLEQFIHLYMAENLEPVTVSV